MKGVENMPKIEDFECESLPPFERNNYFYGKLMTVDDFKVEQEYFVNKHRLINRLVHGSGVICGLRVLKTDENKEECPDKELPKTSLIRITEGVAIDCCGREIVVPRCVDVDLKEKLTLREVDEDRDAYVWIKHDIHGEKLVPVDSETPSDEVEQNYSRISESHRVEVDWELPKSPSGCGDDTCREWNDYDDAEMEELYLRRCPPACKDGVVVLARVRVKRDEDTLVIEMVDNMVQVGKTVQRRLVYGNYRLFELIDSLSRRIEVLDNRVECVESIHTKMKCPHCDNEF